MIIYTGWVTMVTLIGAVLSVALVNGLPTLLPGSGPGLISALRWLLLIVFGAVIFLVGWKTNQKKVMRVGFRGNPVAGVPNTIFFIPLQYWAFFYLLLIGTAIIAWTDQESLAR